VLDQFGQIGRHDGDAITLGRHQCRRNKARQSQENAFRRNCGLDALLRDLMRGMPGFGGRHQNMLGGAKFGEPGETLTPGMVVARHAGIAVGVELLAA